MSATRGPVSVAVSMLVEWVQSSYPGDPELMRAEVMEAVSPMLIAPVGDPLLLDGEILIALDAALRFARGRVTVP